MMIDGASGGAEMIGDDGGGGGGGATNGVVGIAASIAATSSGGGGIGDGCFVDRIGDGSAAGGGMTGAVRPRRVFCGGLLLKAGFGGTAVLGAGGFLAGIAGGGRVLERCARAVSIVTTLRAFVVTASSSNEGGGSEIGLSGFSARR